MKTSIKFLVPTALAGLLGLIAAAQSASAASCGTNNVSWTSLGQCLAPNQNRGSLQGGGDINTNDRDLLLIVAPDSTSGTAEGLTSGFVRASGPNGSCLFTRPGGTSTFSDEGTCNNGSFHRLTISFP